MCRRTVHKVEDKPSLAQRRAPGVSTRFPPPFDLPSSPRLLSSHQNGALFPAVDGAVLCGRWAEYAPKPSAASKDSGPLKLAAPTQPGLRSTRIGDRLEKNTLIISIT